MMCHVNMIQYFFLLHVKVRNLGVKSAIICSLYVLLTSVTVSSQVVDSRR